MIASKTVRAVMDVLGVTDILSKCYGSTNPVNTVKAVFDGFSRMRTDDEHARLRGMATEGAAP